MPSVWCEAGCFRYHNFRVGRKEVEVLGRFAVRLLVDYMAMVACLEYLCGTCYVDSRGLSFDMGWYLR